MSFIKIENIKKIYRRGQEEVTALDGVSLDIKKGSFTSFIGPSGSGKTTLVNIIGCLDNPSSGTIEIDGSVIFKTGNVLTEKNLTKIRRQYFGYIFQSFYLIPTLTVKENILLPYVFYKKSSKDAAEAAKMLGIEKRLNHLPSQLSGGEMQRVAIARALINNPSVILADEPTGNLDTARSEEVGEILRSLNKNEGLTILMVTHNTELASKADKIITIKDGKIYNNP